MEQSKMEKSVSTIDPLTFPHETYLSNTKDEPTEDGYVSILKDFSTSTSAHGIPHIITAKNMFMKLCWFIVTSGALAVLLLQEYDLLKDYFSHSYATKIDLITRTNLTFPAVTVCNMNRMRRSALNGTRFEGLLEVDDRTDNQTQQPETTFTTLQQSYTQDGNSEDINETPTFVDDSIVPTSAASQEKSFDASADDSVTAGSVHERRKRRAKDTIKRRTRDTSSSSSSSSSERYNNFDWLDDFDFEFDDTYDWNGVMDENDWQGFYDNSKSEDFSDILNVANPTKEELQNHGHQPEDFILQCTFDKKSCNYTQVSFFFILICSA
ncbi:amiloride-sensitive sodium channel subunit gamma-2-like [Anneissia japonica]|uniref:amiloride-sensitive sodium channel subunit gamma-2-like n=1 Tax=Anneissia japonica TaxID=1529436 RepID=UPI001425541D|nr:amiloride-sensitive sodium channel subunit gamma-2-like [Anneissia japonica]